MSILDVQLFSRPLVIQPDLHDQGNCDQYNETSRGHRGFNEDQLMSICLYAPILMDSK